MDQDNRPKRGLGALLAATTAPSFNSSTPTAGVQTAEVPVTTIRRNLAQPRTEFDPIALEELAASIKARGLIQPVVVRPLKPEESDGTTKYELIAGERRWRASQIAGLSAIPIVIKAVFDDRDILLLSLVENLQRDDLNTIEEATAYEKLGRMFTLTHDQIAEGVGKSRAYISNMIRLLELPPNVLELIKTKKLSTGHGKILLGIPDPRLQQHLASKTIAENLSVRDLERIVQGDQEEDDDEEDPLKAPRKKNSRSTRAPSTSELRALEQRLREHFGTKVRIEEGSRKGRIVIEFYSTDDLDRISGLMGLE